MCRPAVVDVGHAGVGRAARRYAAGVMDQDADTELQHTTPDPDRLTVLVASLVRCDLAGDHGEILAAARA